ncbi:uncharacterized protein PRCAT00001139001 [Priceomyces carsonii]|uniref:uncharacterized protein n=1 Tax=Priceomyces carsonii TaxID=28549 RepID=UPI002EDA0C64|nr:unnamed protein product [Priceomyces carsonii]
MERASEGEHHNERSGSKSAGGAYFISTQMQARHEEVINHEQDVLSKRKSLSMLQKYKNENINDVRNLDMRRTKTQMKKSRRKKKMSMNDLVRDTFGNISEEMSGSQSKIDQFLKSITRVNDLEGLTKKDTYLYSKEEWISIMKSIKMKFPNLSDKYKRNLNGILGEIAMIEKEEAKYHGLWTHASSHPESKLSDSDLKWLYDLNDNQVGSSCEICDGEGENVEERPETVPYVSTLSQIFNDRSDHLDELHDMTEILNSEWEPSPLLDPPVKLLDNFDIEVGMGNDIISDNRLHTYGSELKEAAEPSMGTNEIIEIGSSPGNEEKPRDVLTIYHDEAFSSKQNSQVLSSIYSTARSQIQSYSLPSGTTNLKGKKPLHTSRVEVPSVFNVREFKDHDKKISLTYLYSRPVLIDSDNEIQDSEDDPIQDNSISVIEITREEDVTNDLICISSEDDVNYNLKSAENTAIDKSILQVCSSPDTKLKEDLNFSLPAEENLINDDTFVSPSQSRSIESQNLPLSPLSKYNMISSESQKLDCDNSNTFLSMETHAILITLLKQDRYWLDRILSFEPFPVEELMSRLQRSNIKIEMSCLESFLDESGISYFKKKHHV